MRYLHAFLVSIILSISAAHAQGLIGACPEHCSPSEYQRQLRDDIRRLELERSTLYLHGLNDRKSRTIYFSVVWTLSIRYEDLMCWQEAINAQNSGKALHVNPEDACLYGECECRFGAEIMAMDAKNLQEKIEIIESVENVKFDKGSQLPPPNICDTFIRELSIRCLPSFENSIDYQNAVELGHSINYDVTETLLNWLYWII